MGLEGRHTKETVKSWSLGPKVPVPASYKFQEKERKKQKKYSRTKRIKCSVLDETGVSIFSRLTEEI